MLHKSGRQEDGSIIDIYGNIISSKEAMRTLEVVYSLPAREHIEKFLKTLDENPIVIVEWETGSGKTTQLPKSIHQKYPNKNIVVTQPRVLAAKSNAHRVSQELLIETGDPDYSIGEIVWYRTWQEQLSSHRSKLLFNTDGTEYLRQSMAHIHPDVLILDEFHNYQIPTETLAYEARSFLLQKKYRHKAMKLVISSATLNIELVQEYFKDVSKDIPIIKIPGRTFGVKSDYDASGDYLDALDSAIKAKHNTLFFVSGKKEIESHIQEIQRKFGNLVETFPLHSELTRAEQDAILKNTSKKPRIIVSTNVAEESITIDYIDFVISTGEQKVLRYNEYGIPMLGVEETSLANEKQRAGRSGRTKPGIFKRFNNTPSKDLKAFPEAPLEREMIEREILIFLSQWVDIIRLIYEGDDENRAPFFHSVDITLFEFALEKLRTLGALTQDNKLTTLWNELIKFPVNIEHARMLYEAIEQDCLTDIIPFVAILSKKGFTSKEDRWKGLLETGVYNSDLWAYVTLLDIVTSTTLSSKMISFFTENGINPDEIKDFMDRKGTAKVYEIIDLTKIGLKNKKIKEIDDMIFKLREKLSASWFSLNSSNDTYKKKLALTSGSLNQVYAYDKHSRKFYMHTWIKNIEWFIQGNVSVIQPIDKKLYIMSPFIIISNDERDNFHIGTNFIEINEDLIREVSIMNAAYGTEEFILHPKSSAAQNSNTHQKSWDTKLYSKIQTKNPAWDVKQVSAREIMQPYNSLSEEFHKVEHASYEAAQQYYLQYCLIPFLFERNKSIADYIKDKDDTWRAHFAELLKQFIEKYDLYRIDPDALIKTEARFSHDSDLLSRFQDASEPHIRDFRIHGVMKKSVQSIPNMTETLVVDAKEDMELSLKKQEFARLLWMIKHYNRPISLEEIGVYGLTRDIDALSDSKSPKLLSAYVGIWENIKKIQSMAPEDQKTMTRALKSIGNKKKEYKVRLEHMQSLLHRITTGNSMHITPKVLQNAEKDKYFWELNHEDSEKFQKIMEQIQSHDKRKKARWVKNLQKYQTLLTSQIGVVKKSLTDIQNDDIIAPYSNAIQILEDVHIISSLLFTEKYMNSVLQIKLYDIMRMVIRESIWNPKKLEDILKDAFTSVHIGRFLTMTEWDYKILEHHRDMMDEVWNYSNWSAIYSNLMNLKDVTEVNTIIKKLSDLIIKLSESAKLVDKNSLWQSYNTMQK